MACSVLNMKQCIAVRQGTPDATASEFRQMLYCDLSTLRLQADTWKAGSPQGTQICKTLQTDSKDSVVRHTFQHTGLAVVLQGLVRPRLRGTELEFWRNSEEARTDRPSQQLRSLNGEWRLMRYFLLTHLCGISHRIWCTLSTICSDAA
jgi:hypothetical protein